MSWSGTAILSGKQGTVLISFGLAVLCLLGM